MISILYEIGLFVLALLAAPWFFYQWAFKGKYRNNILKRFGSGFPLIKKGKRPLIWVHAVSLGETKAVAALVKAIKSEFNHPIIVFSTTTETGYVEGCRTITADHHVYLPFDFGWVIKPIMKRTAPDLLVLCESDFWFNLLTSAKEAGAVVALVNGKISERSVDRFLMFPSFADQLFKKIDFFYVQSALYRQRFERLGIAPEKIMVTGNMKFDGDYSKLPTVQLDAWRRELGIAKSDHVLVIGSTHHPEEIQLLATLKDVWKVVPNLKVILVPRHPERFNEVAGLLQKNNILFRRLSHKSSDCEAASVILIDAMGLLRKCYQLADVAIVAGSYTPTIGGHNILEPAWYGIPFIFGPYMHTQPDLVDLVSRYKAGLQIDIDALPQTLLTLLQDKTQRKAYGDAGLRLAADVHGATTKTCQLLKKQTRDIKRLHTV